MRVHRDRLLQHIIQVKPCPAVYDKGCLGKNILVHLVQGVPELGHTHPIQVKDQGIEIPGVLTAPPPPKVGQGRHDGKVRIVDLRQLRQFIGDRVAFGLAFLFDLQGDPCRLRRHRHRDSVPLCVLKMTLPFKATHREDLPVKFKGCDRLQELLQMLILFPVQFLQPLHNGLLIHSHMLTSKRKSNKKKSAAAGIACGREGGKG